MPRTARLVLLLLLVVAWSGLAPGPRPARAEEPVPAPWNGRDRAREVERAIREYFEADAERRDAIRTFLDELGPLRERDVARWTKRVWKEMARHGPEISRKSGETFTHGALTGTVYTAGRPRRGGALFVALHGGGEGSGDGRNALSKWSLVQSKAFVIAPTAPELRGSAWNQPDIEAWVLALIEAAIRTFDLDPQRIYLAGHSMGGYGTWSMGCRHADRFAALGACAGGIFTMGGAGGAQTRLAPGHIPNLLNTPIWFFNSTDDPRVRPDSSQAANRQLLEWKEAGLPYVWVYEEYDDIGHGFPPMGVKPIVDWMLPHKRAAHPKHVIFEPSRPTKRRLYWLGSSVDRRIEGQIEGNTVTLTTAGRPGSATIHWNADLLDVTEPVRVLWNGEEKFHGRVGARLSVILETAAETRDEDLTYDRVLQLP